jgi:4-carboxymuconolactone decarboxylase
MFKRERSDDMSYSRRTVKAAAITLGIVACEGCTPTAAQPPGPGERSETSTASQTGRSEGSEAPEDRYARGLAKLEEIDGEVGVKVIESLQDIAPDLGRYVIEYPFGDIYTRPGLDLRSREIATVAALTALGHSQPQLAVHVHGALNVGCTRTEVVEIITQMSVYAGFPAALNGMATAKRVFAERDRRGQSDR